VLERWAGSGKWPSFGKSGLVVGTGGWLALHSMEGRFAARLASKVRAAPYQPSDHLSLVFLHHFCNPILDIPVQTLPKLHQNGQAIGDPASSTNSELSM